MLCTMRKRWAERVNEMFKERGIDAEITEKITPTATMNLLNRGVTKKPNP